VAQAATLERQARRNAARGDRPARPGSRIEHPSGVRSDGDGGRRSEIATVYGGGGVFGIAYNLGIAEAFVDHGVDLGSAAAIGTSAGAWAAAHLALGLRFEDRFDRFADQIPRRPDPRSDRLVELAREVFGDGTRCPTVRVGVVALPRLRRHTLSGGDHPIAELVAASSSVPGMLAPHRIDGVRYVDGGIRSMASADLGEHATRLLVVLPMSGPMFGPAGRLIERRTIREIEMWRGHHAGAHVTVVRPTPRIANLVRRPDQLFDPERARACHRFAYQQGVDLARVWSRADTVAA
jgi:NTE family protein